MKASLVFDGQDGPHVPVSMGTPSLGQLEGTAFEKLGELASRICYDSLGCGRSSAALHKHILEVINLSVYEHLNFTLAINHTGESQMLDFIQGCANRKGTWIKWDEDTFEITANFRAILEWDAKTRPCQKNTSGAFMIGSVLRYMAGRLAPQIVPETPCPYGFGGSNTSLLKTDQLDEDQACITLWLYGSRGFTHEQVRHRFAMSQRSTRYVDESVSEYVMHPLIDAYFKSDESVEDKQILFKATEDSVASDRATYNGYVTFLESYLTKKGLDRTTARKQARGAARGFLGNALASEMLFTAPVSGWKIILGQRLNKFADAEIRAVYADALIALKSSVYGHFFTDYTTVPSPDGLGLVLA